MTYKEARDVLKEQIDKYGREYDEKGIEALNVAIKVLEQQPCEDCISREAVIEWLKDKDIIKMNYQEENARRELAELPSVTPQQPCEEENPTCTECRYYDKEKHHCPRFCKVIETTMAEITSEQTRWIPCSARLPEEYIHVLCQFTLGGMGECYLAHGVFHVVGGLVMTCNEVIAWMPLPQSYEAESEDKE